MRTSSNDIRRGHMALTTQAKQASSRTKKDGKEYGKQHIPGEKNKHLGTRKDKGHMYVIEQVRKRNWAWAGYVSRIQLGNTTIGKDPEEGQRDGGQTN